MAKAPKISVPEMPSFEEDPGDELTVEEVEQAEVGDLITIQGPQFDSVSWSIWRHRTRQEMASESDGQPVEWVADRTGQLHGADLIELLGGGTFNFRGYVPRADGHGVRIKYNRTITLAGPRKNFAATPPVVVAPTATPSPNGSLTRGERIMLKMFRRMDDRISQIDKTPAAAPAPPTLKDLADTLSTLDSLRERHQPAPSNPDKEIVNTMFDLVGRGIELGQARDPIPVVERPATDWIEVFKAAMPLVDRVLARVPVRRPMPPPVGARVDAVPPASSTVETQPEPGGPMNYRWPTAIEALANAIADGEDPAEFAITLEHILNKHEFGMLRQATVELVMSEVGVAIATYPILDTPQARAFIEALLAEIKNPASPDGQ